MTDHELLERLRDLSPEEKRRLIERRRTLRTAARAEADAMPSPTEGGLSPAQERLHFLQLLLPTSSVYHVTASANVTGPIDLDRLERALHLMAKRQPCLRMRIVDRGATMVQEVVDDPVIDLVVVDVASQNGDHDNRLNRWREAATRRVTTPFDMSDAPLWRITIGRLAEDVHDVVVTMHHVIADDWSMRIFFEELLVLYSSESKATADVQLGRPASYLEWVADNRRAEGTTDHLQRLDYWRDLLGRGTPNLDLATDFPRPAVQVGNGELWTAALDAGVGDGLRRLAQERQTSPFVTLLAAWAALLARHGTSDRFVVGAPVSNRDTLALERTIGLFVDTVPIVIDLDPETSIEELVDHVAERFRNALSNLIPLEEIIDVSKPPRTRDRSPLFQTMVTLHNVPRSDMTLAGLSLAPARGAPRHTTAMYDISLDVADGDELTVVIEYDSDLFARPRIDQMGDRLLAVCRQMVETPSVAVADVDLTVPAEDVPRLPPVVSCIHERIFQAAEQYPMRDAVVCDGHRLTYRELAERAERLKRQLVASGVRPERPVAVLLPRSVDLIVAMTAVMAAGGIYTPIDPGAPTDRVSAMIRSGGFALVLTDAATAPHIDRSGIPVRIVGSEGIEGVEPADRPAAPTGVVPDNAAYMIFTSGSTGTPKGVVVPHTGLVSLERWYADFYRTDEVTRHLSTANHAFDAFLGDVGRSLMAGGTLVMARRDEIVEPSALHRLITEESIECMETVPAVMRVLAPWLRANGLVLDGLRSLIVGSDAWYGWELGEYADLIPPDVPIVCAYGVTEATVDSTYFEGRSVELHPHQLVPIGHAVANTVVHVLDRRLRPVAPGVVGELYIGGRGLARCYHNRAGLTAERFVPDAFNPTGGRLYATGDRCRLLGNGEIEFLGRHDRQLKIRGFRVEPDEVELVLAAHPEIREAAVVVRNGETDSAHLAAYVVAKTGAVCDPAEIGAYARRRLPSYMVPATIVRLDQLPRTTSYKVDRSALPEGGDTMPSQSDAVVEWTGSQAALRDIWEQVLETTIPHPEADLFDLGAHSLIVPRLVSRMETELGLSIPVVALFDHPSIAAIDRFIGRRATSADALEVETLDVVAMIEDSRRIPTTYAPTVSGAPTRIVLTGATGFFGRHLLERLVDRTEAEILCVVRAPNREVAWTRIVSMMAANQLATPDPARVIPACGDLEQPDLGLSVDDWARAMEAECIIHAAASVNLVFPYSRLRSANVESTQRVMTLAARSGARLHHMSTAGVAGIDASTVGAVGSGYLQSKWTAEESIRHGFDLGLSGAIHRPDFIAGSTTGGVCNQNDFVWAMVRGVIELGCWPDVAVPVSMVPADRIAEAVTAIAVAPADNGIHDLSHPRPLLIGELFRMIENNGYGIKPLPGREWLNVFEAALTRGEAATLEPFRPILRLAFGTEPAPTDRSDGQTEPTFEAGVPDGYEVAGVACPDIDRQLINLYLDRFISVGYLPPPEGREGAS